MIDVWDSLARTIAALAVVLLLMGLVAWGARRVLGARPGPSGAEPVVQVLGTTYLAPRKSVALLSVAGEYLIVGMTADDLVPLGRIENQQNVQAWLAESASSVQPSHLTPGPSAWLHQLSEVVRKGKQDRHAD